MNIELTTAKRLHGQAPKWFQEQLEEFFGKKSFEIRPYTEIKTFEDACDELGIIPEDILPEGMKLSDDEIAYRKLKVIVRAINQGWIPDWDNTDQKKWWPWFRLSSGFGFDYSVYHCDGTLTAVGSRLCTDTSEKALYIASTFEAEYKDYFLYAE